ncbi:regulating synaptic membrane exocytosis protein 1 [Hyalella azteca]|uniref:Regulating synaptic membrane exocytosis protein 1 n=1 Tax=Hyalella azteca TaxID=294128 RepID=A0A979FKM9_HYAAZ|nr:regulating synaptic membrane exocytosis protein 1 [Hyalella azteca]
MAGEGGEDLMPDLSHLDDHERRIIEQVMQRHRLEEAKESELVRRKREEVRVLEDTIRLRSESQRRRGAELEATCQICVKTKFADGIGHLCHYCNVRCCARCGGKVTLRSNKVIWVCILCRKKQELLTKTGSWMSGGPGDDPEFDYGAGGLFPSDSYLGSRREKHYHKDYRKPKDEIRDPISEAELSRNSDAFSRPIFSRYRHRQNLYGTRLGKAYPVQVREECCDSRATDNRSYTERRKKTVRFNSEGWDTIEDDLDPSAVEDTRWSSAYNVYYDEERCPPGRPGPTSLHPNYAPMRDHGSQLLPLPRRVGGWGGPNSGPNRELPIPAVRRQSWDVERQESQDSQTKDSGIDSGTSSNFNSSEDSSKGDLPRTCRHPVSWQPSQDGSKMIGHMILNKAMRPEHGGQSSSAAILGLKVGGGKILDSGKIGAVVEKVKKGSIADTVGHLRPGDEVLEWNGRVLSGLTFEEVYDVISESCHEAQVELIVARQLTDIDRHPARRHTHAGLISRGGSHDGGFDPRKLSEPGRDRRPSVTITSPGSPDNYRTRLHSPSIGGKLQLKLFLDSQVQQLIVTVISASELPLRATGVPRNPYAKLFLLPDRSEKSKRRTKTIAGTCQPRWNQTFVYAPVRVAELRQRSLQVTVWDYDRFGTNDFLGEVLVDLNAAALDDEPEWYSLAPPDDMLTSHSRRTMCLDTESASTLPSIDHLSPPSTASRLSESDMSDADLEDSLHQRKMEQASLSSVGSSSSPPPDDHRGFGSYEHRSRREDPRFRSPGHMMGFGGSLGASVGPPYKDYIPAPIPMSARGRSQSAAPTDSPSLHVSRSRSKSPRRIPDVASRSLSPPEARPEYGGMGGGRPLMTSRSETATPTSSPKKRQLPQIPAALQHANRDKITQRNRDSQDLEERARHMKLRLRQMQPQGHSRSALNSGYSDSEIGARRYDRYTRGASRGALASPERDPLERDLGDSASDIESVVSGASTFSTQSERPRGSVKHSSRQHFSSSLTCAPSIFPTDSSYSHPDWYAADVSGVVRDQLPLPEVRLWPRETTDQNPFHSSSSNDRDKKSRFVPTFNAADFSTSESSPPFSIEDNQYLRRRFQSRSNPAIGSFQSRNLPPLQRSNTVRSFFPPSPVKVKLLKSRSIGDEFNVLSSNGSDEIFIDCRFNDAMRSKSSGDLHRYYSKKVPSHGYNSRGCSASAHSPPQVPFRNSDSGVERRWRDEARQYVDRRPRRRDAPPRHALPARQRPCRDAGHDAGTYYGYDSEYSGAETEVFLSDRSFDRSFSQENDSDPYNSGSQCDCMYAMDECPQIVNQTPSSLPIIERISPDWPPRKPLLQPRKLVRAKTEGSLIDYARKDQRLRQETPGKVDYSNTLPRTESSSKKKKQVNFPFPSPTPKVKGNQHIGQNSELDSTKMRSDYNRRNHPHSQQYLINATSKGAHADQSSFCSDCTTPFPDEIIHSRFDSCYDKSGIDNDRYGPSFHSYDSSDATCSSCEERRSKERYLLKHDNCPIHCGELSSYRERDTDSIASPMHSLNLSYNTSACPSVKRQTIYTADCFSHSTDRAYREPIPPKPDSSHECFSVPFQLHVNTRVRPSSSVSINEQPQYFEFDANSPPTKEYRVIADVAPSSDPASELSDRMSGYGAPGGAFGGSGKRGTFARSLSTSEVPETEKAAKKGVRSEAKPTSPLAGAALGIPTALPLSPSSSTTKVVSSSSAAVSSPSNNGMKKLEFHVNLGDTPSTEGAKPDPDGQLASTPSNSSSPRLPLFDSADTQILELPESSKSRGQERGKSHTSGSTTLRTGVAGVPATEACSSLPEQEEESEKGTSSTSSERELGATKQSELHDNVDGSLSDSAAGSFTLDPKERTRLATGDSFAASTPGGGSSPGKSDSSIAGLAKKSSSTSKLSDTGRKRKLGFRKKSRSTITVHRSEEILPTASRHLLRQSSSQSSEEVDAELWESRGTRRRAPTGELTEFIEGLGPGQLVGRQVLAAPTLGDIQLSMCERKNKLEVEVIRARGLQCKSGCKTLPAPYVKVYLVDGKKCVAKAKTATARRTLDPLYQQQLIFHERYHGCVLQVTVWGDYGRMEGRKIFMGVAQILLDDLDLSNIVIGWYKLFGTSSLVSLPTFTRRGSVVSLESFEERP